MKTNREQLLAIKNGNNLYEQFKKEGHFDGWSESIFSHIKETIDLLIDQIDKNESPESMHAFLRKRFLKMGWDKFLFHMEYVRPNHPDNKPHDEVNKSYYDQMAKAIGLDNFQEFIEKPFTKVDSLKESQKLSLSKLDQLTAFHGKEKVKLVKQAFKKCLNEIGKSKESLSDKTIVIAHFEKLLGEISKLNIYDTEDREVIADLIQDCFISYGYTDSGGMLEQYL